MPSPRDRYVDRVRELAESAPPVSGATLARLVDILRPTDPRTRLAAAVELRPDLPAGIAPTGAEVAGDG